MNHVCLAHSTLLTFHLFVAVETLSRQTLVQLIAKSKKSTANKTG
jgi:hypothetical protein